MRPCTAAALSFLVWIGTALAGVPATADAAQIDPDPATAIVPASPAIPNATFDLSNYGAVGDYQSFDTDAFKKAIGAIAKAGGGRLIVRPGTYKTLPFELTSHMDLHLEPGATIKAPDRLADYGIPDPSLPSTQPTTTQYISPGGRHRPPPLISAPPGTTDVSITGGGTIDGSGAIFWIWSDKAARRYPPGRTVLGRPILVSLTGIERLHVDGITLTNSPMFHLVPRGRDILIENVRIVAPSDAPNTDAIDPSGQRIVIRNCEIDTGDDDVALGGGTRDVLIENLTCLHGHGISIGSGTRAGLSHIFVRHCTFDGTDNGLRIKSYRGNGGEVHDVWYSDITMKNVRRPFDINMRYNGNANTQVDVAPPDFNAGRTPVPDFHDIHVTNLTVTRSPIAGRIIGLAEQMPNRILFSNVTFDTVRGFYVEDAKDVVFNRARFDVALGAPIITVHASVTVNGHPADGSGAAAPFYAGN